MEVLADATVALRPSKPASFRQKWEKEPFGTIGFRLRNLATNGCLIAPSTASTTRCFASAPAAASATATCGGSTTR